MGDRGHNRHGPKRGVALLCVFRGAELGNHLTQCGLGRGLLPYQVAHLHPSSRLATIDMDRKLVVCPFGGGGAGSPANNVARAEAYLHTKWHLDLSSRLATVDMSRKLGRGCAPFGGGRAGFPSNTMWPRPRPTACQVSS